MRKITNEAIRAFEGNTNFKSGNTQVVADCTGTYLYLWGNNIARKCGNRLQINLCGYNTVTTRERLNGLQGVSLTTRKGQAILNGQNIPSCEWIQV